MKLCGNLKYSQSHLYSTVVPPDGKLSYHFFDSYAKVFPFFQIKEVWVLNKKDFLMPLHVLPAPPLVQFLPLCCHNVSDVFWQTPTPSILGFIDELETVSALKNLTLHLARL